MRNLLPARPGWEVCGEASNGDEAVIAAELHHPDVVILDVMMPGPRGDRRGPRDPRAPSADGGAGLHHARDGRAPGGRPVGRRAGLRAEERSDPSAPRGDRGARAPLTVRHAEPCPTRSRAAGGRRASAPGVPAPAAHGEGTGGGAAPRQRPAQPEGRERARHQRQDRGEPSSERDEKARAAAPSWTSCGTRSGTGSSTRELAGSLQVSPMASGQGENGSSKDGSGGWWPFADWRGGRRC